MRDLTKGLTDYLVEDRWLVGPLKRDIACLAEAAAEVFRKRATP